MQPERQGDAGGVDQLPQVLVCQLSVDTTEEHLRDAFKRCEAPLAHVYLSRVPLHDPEDEKRQESWCLGYAFCTLKRNSDLKRALKVLQVGSSPSVRIAQLDRQAIVSPFPGARIPSKHSSSSASQATPAGPQSNSSAAPLSHAKGSTEEAGQKHPHQHEQQQQQQQQQQQRQSDGPSSSSLCPPLQNQGPNGPDVKGSGKRGVDECVDAEDGELRAGKVARREVAHPNNGSTPSAAAGVSTASNGLAAACLTSNGVGCNGGAHGNTAGGVSTGGRGAQQQGGGQGAQPQVQQQQQQQSQRPMLAKQQSMLPALMGSDPLAQLQQICAERGLRMKLREAPVPHNFDPQTDPRVSVEDAASVAAAAAKAAEVAREMMLLQQEIDNEEGCIGDRAMEGGLNGSTNQGDPRSQDEDLANRQVLAASQWVCVEGSVMDLSGYKVLALASAITPQKDKARRQAAFCMLRDILQQHPEFLPSGSTAPLPSRHRKQQDQGSKGGQTAKAPAPKERPSSSSRPPPLSNQTRSVNPRHQSQLPHYPQQGHGHSHRLSSSHSQGSAERSQPHLPHPQSSAERPAPQQWRPFKPGSAPYGGAVHPTPNSLMLTDMSGSGIPLEVVHLLDSCNKDGGCPSAAELVNGYCIRERARAVFVESPTLPGMQGFFGCDAMMQSNPTNPGERPAVLFGPATGYGRNKQMAKQAAAAMLLNMLLLDGTDPSAFRRTKQRRPRG